MKYLSILILPLTLFASSIEAEKVIDAGGCQTKLIQKMEPQYPNTNFQGYAVIKFNINEMGALSNTKVKESMCVDSRSETGEIIFTKCPFFKAASVDASRYLKYKLPVDKNGQACSIKDHEYTYNYSLYSQDFKKDGFMSRDELIESLSN